jgi:hypothetical protein
MASMALYQMGSGHGFAMSFQDLLALFQNIANRVNNGVIPRATTVVARDPVANVCSARLWQLLDQLFGRPQHARCAKSALKRIFANKRLLQITNDTRLTGPLDREHFTSISLHGQSQATSDNFPIQFNGTRPTNAMFAT